jgi:hypothetical protein
MGELVGLGNGCTLEFCISLDQLRRVWIGIWAMNESPVFKTWIGWMGVDLHNRLDRQMRTYTYLDKSTPKFCACFIVNT